MRWASVLMVSRDLILERDRITDNEPELLSKMPTEMLQPIFKFYVMLALCGGYPAELQTPADGETPFPTSVVKRLLTAMARPMPGYQPHQVGAGFVNEEIATEYLLKFRQPTWFAFYILQM